jgi:hypothetical protein
LAAGAGDAMRRPALRTVGIAALEVAGVVAIVAGVALIYAPAAWIVVGVGAIALALLLER